jgi:hypothetical protein
MVVCNQLDGWGVWGKKDGHNSFAGSVALMQVNATVYHSRSERFPVLIKKKGTDSLPCILHFKHLNSNIG